MLLVVTTPPPHAPQATFEVFRIITYAHVLEIQPLATRTVAIGLVVALYAMHHFVSQVFAAAVLCATRAWGVFLMCALVLVVAAVSRGDYHSS